MKLFRIHFGLFLLFAWTTLLHAEHVPLQKAQQFAAAFLQKNLTRSAVFPHHLKLVYDGEDAQTRSKGSLPTYYVFNNTSGPGFVIVAADNIITPVLAYSNQQSFKAESMPQSLRSWLQRMRYQINYARQNGYTATPEINSQWKRNTQGEPKVELVTANWDQAEPYWNLTPKYMNNHTYTGCVATALAIVMRYHEWPTQGTGTLPGYITQTYRLNVPNRTLGHTYEWSLMPLSVRNNISQQQANAIAQLVYDCSVLVKADFHLEGTGAFEFDIPDPMIKHMNYDKGVFYAQRDTYRSQEWYNLLKNELDQRRPVLYTGNDAEYTMGHAFVLDGYDSRNFFSVNWGWSGMCNGYYQLDAFQPEDLGIGGGEAGDYSYGQSALIGLQPDKGNPQNYQLRFSPFLDNYGNLITHGLSTTEKNIEKDKSFPLSFGLAVSLGASLFEGDISMAVYNAQGKMKPNSDLYYWTNNNRFRFPMNFTAEDQFQIAMGIGVAHLPVSVPVNIEPGDVICMIYKSKGSNEWKIVQGNDEQGCVWKLPLTPNFKPLDQGTRLSYNKRQGRLQVNSFPDTQIQLLDANNHALSDRITISNVDKGKQADINVQNLKGCYKLCIMRGVEQYILDLTF